MIAFDGVLFFESYRFTIKKNNVYQTTGLKLLL